MNLGAPFRGLAQAAAGRIRRWRAAALLGVLAAAAAVVGCVFLFAAVYLYLATLVSAWLAASATAAIAVGLAAAFALAARSALAEKPEPQRGAARPQEAPPSSAAIRGDAASESSARRADLVVSSFVAGVALGMGGGRRGRSSQSAEP